MVLFNFLNQGLYDELIYLFSKYISSVCKISQKLVSTGSKKYKLSAVLVNNKREGHLNYLKKKSIMSSLQKLHGREIFEK